MADKYLLEDGSGGYLLEDGSGVLLLEATDPLYPVTKFHNVAQQFTGAAEFVGYAVAFAAAASIVQGALSVSDYQYGAHAPAIYNAEAEKQQFSRPATSPATVAQLGKFQSVQQQSYLDVQPDIQTSLFRGQTPPIIPFQRTDGQNDLTQQPQVWKAVVTPPAVTTGLLGKFQNAYPQIDATLQAVYSQPPTAFVSTLSTQTFGGQDDPTQPSPVFWHIHTTPPAPKQIVPYVVAAPQSVDLTLQPSIWRTVVRGQTPPIIPYQIGGPSPVDLTQQPTFWPVTVAPPIVGRVATFQITLEQPQDRPTVTVFPAQSRGHTPPIVPFQVGGPQPVDLTIQPVISKLPVFQPYVPITGPTVHPQYFVPQQSDPSPNRSVVWTEVPLSVAGIAGNMPNVVGMNYYMALLVLQQAGIYVPNNVLAFNVTAITVRWAKSNLAGGIVVAQSPASGTRAVPNQPITLTIATYPFGADIDSPPDWTQRT